MKSWTELSAMLYSARAWYSAARQEPELMHIYFRAFQLFSSNPSLQVES